MKRLETIYSLSILVFFLTTYLILANHGKEGRSYSARIVTIGESAPEIIIIGGDQQAYQIWKERGLRGRIVVHFDDILDVTPLSYENMLAIFHNDTDKIRRLASGPEKLINEENYVLFAMADEVARKVIGIVSTEKLSQIDDDLKAAGYIGSGGVFRSGFMGISKIITDIRYMPSFDEPVLLDLDPDYFSHHDVSARGLFEELKRAKVRTDLVTVSKMNKTGYADAEALEKINAFLALLRGAHG